MFQKYLLSSLYLVPYNLTTALLVFSSSINDFLCNKHWTNSRTYPSESKSYFSFEKRKNPYAKKNIRYSSSLFLRHLQSFLAYFTEIRFPPRPCCTITETRPLRTRLFPALPLHSTSVLFRRQLLRCGAARGPGGRSARLFGTRAGHAWPPRPRV